MNWNSKDYLDKIQNFNNNADSSEKVKEFWFNTKKISEELSNSMTLSNEELQKVIGI